MFHIVRRLRVKVARCNVYRLMTFIVAISATITRIPWD
jgi:hypothetical protein